MENVYDDYHAGKCLYFDFKMLISDRDDYTLIKMIEIHNNI